MILRNITAKLIISGPRIYSRGLLCSRFPSTRAPASRSLVHKCCDIREHRTRVGRNRRELVHIEFWLVIVATRLPFHWR
jgi:hypothetical protein